MTKLVKSILDNAAAAHRPRGIIQPRWYY
jgi:hypothetical protein